jgi:hypothetical protein
MSKKKRIQTVDGPKTVEVLSVDDFGGVDNESSADPYTGSSDLPDVSVGDFLEEPRQTTPVQPSPDRLDPMELPPKKLLNLVMRKGLVMFPDNSTITKCPCRSNPAACPLIPMPHPSTGDSIMVCHGPSVQKKTKGGIIREKRDVYSSGRYNSRCPYSPDRLNEEPEYKEDGVDEGWL